MAQATLMDKKPEKRFIGLTGNMWIYALGLMGINLAIGLVNSYQAEFFNKILNADLIAVAVIILVAKFVSIFADFVIGNLIDRANFKAGKMRPWILMSAFPLAVLTMFSFAAIPFGSSTGGKVGMYIYITIILILWNISMTMADIPVQGMLSFVANNSNDTNNAAGMGNTLRSIALACSGVFITIVCMLTGSEDVTWVEYLIVAGILSGLGLIFQLLMYFKGREQYKVQASSAMSFREMFRELKSNKMILIVFLTYILGFGRNIGMGLAVQATCILVRDGIDLSFIGMGVLYGDGCSWLIGITSAVSSMVTILLNPVINKKLGEKRYFIIAGMYGFGVSLIAFLMYVFGGAPLRSIWAILVYQFFLGFAYGPNGYLPMVMTADIVDYQEWKTGKRTEGTQFAIMSMSNKLSNALSVSLGLLLIGAIGYSSATYDSVIQSNPAAISTYITDAMQNEAWAIYFLIPGLCMLASSIVMFFYKIDGKTKKLMREELAARHAAEGADKEDGETVEPTTENADEPFKELDGDSENAAEKPEAGGNEENVEGADVSKAAEPNDGSDGGEQREEIYADPAEPDADSDDIAK